MCRTYIRVITDNESTFTNIKKNYCKESKKKNIVFDFRKIIPNNDSAKNLTKFGSKESSVKLDPKALNAYKSLGFYSNFKMNPPLQVLAELSKKENCKIYLQCVSDDYTIYREIVFDSGNVACYTKRLISDILTPEDFKVIINIKDRLQQYNRYDAKTKSIVTISKDCPKEVIDNFKTLKILNTEELNTKIFNKYCKN